MKWSDIAKTTYTRTFYSGIIGTRQAKLASKITVLSIITAQVLN